ncbi:MAG: trypsin-like peptidase domain-containing protein [Candidatus Omnitrophica bacterium]|nr:trypsin-like peptidase domain-containing protein [Candidatus Omnitrophota bacterium]
MKKTLILFLAYGLIAGPSEATAEVSILNTLMQSQEAIVSILSENAVIYGEKSKPVLDKNTGRILVPQALQPVKYTRTGAGVIVDPVGLIVANAHTVKQAARVTVTLLNGQKYEAKILELNSEQDLAILGIEPRTPLRYVRLANSNLVKLRSRVYSVGSSQLLHGTISQGKVSGLGRSRGNKALKGKKIVGLIQINFDLYQGDSGSPIFNAEGEVIGIISAGPAVRSNKTFAIPSNQIIQMVAAYVQKQTT